MNLSPLFNPADVAVIGASPRQDAMGSHVVRNLVSAGFKGTIFPLHPTAGEVQGLRCHPDLRSLPRVPECVVVALSADKVVAALTEAAALGVKAAVVLASGFAEIGPVGEALQAEIEALGRATGLLVCGPNCLGLVDVHANTALYSAPLPVPLIAGGVAIVSHSGSACIALAGTGRIGVSHMVSVGNAAVLDVDDYLRHFAQDPAVRVAGLFIESIRNPAGFAEAAKLMREAGKPIVLLRVGRSRMGSAATAAHTGSLAGPDAAYVDFFRKHGVIVANDMDELVETCVLLQEGLSAPQGDGVAVLNVSGGEIALTCDLAESVGLRFARLSAATLGRLKDVLPAYATASNPLDVTGTGVSDTDLYRLCIDALARDEDVAVIAISQDCPPGIGPAAAAGYRRITQLAARLSAEYSKPIVFYSNIGGGLHPDVVGPLGEAPVAALLSARPALQAIRHWVTWCGWKSGHEAPGTPLPLLMRWQQRFATLEPLSEAEAKRFLCDHGIPVPRERIAASLEDAVGVAAEIGYPLVMKIDSPDIAHKTEAGGVVLGIGNEAELRAAHQQILANVHAHHPGARVNGISIQEMVVGGVEMIASTSHSLPFGVSLLVGTGGTWVELVRDSAVALAPVTSGRALTLLGATRASALLDGFRGSRPADRAAFVDLMVLLSEIAVGYQEFISTIELNPVSVLQSGRGVRVLDAWIELRNRATTGKLKP